MIQHPLPVSLLIFDADDTLRRETKNRPPYGWNRSGGWELFPDVRPTLARYDWGAVGFGIASNQGGIGSGHVTEYEVVRELYRMLYQIFPSYPFVYTEANEAYQRRRMPERGSPIRISTGRPQDKPADRKPHPTMIWDLMREYGIARAYPHHNPHVLFVGDSEDDLGTARNARVMFMPAWEFFNRPEEPLRS
jgi:histidinol phosphatase-like enzyme